MRQLLTHSSGIDWWAPLYKEIEGRRPRTSSGSSAMDLSYEPGTKSLYSDLGPDPARRDPGARGGRAARAFARRAHLRSARHEGHAATARRPALLAAHRADRERSLARARAARRGARRERVRAGRRGAARRPVLDRGRPGAVRADAAQRRRVRPPAHRLARDGRAFTRRAGVPGSAARSGWDTPDGDELSAGALFSARAFGHTGLHRARRSGSIPTRSCS